MLIISTPSLFKRVGVINIAFSDHYPIYGFATRPNKHRTVTRALGTTKKINDFIADSKQAPWSLIDSFTDVDDMCSAWESLMKSLIGRHFPLKKKRIRKQTHPWLDSTVLKVMRTLDQVHKRAKTPRLSSDWNEYKLPRNKVTAMNRQVRKNYFRNKLEENRGKRKVVWDTLRQVLPSNNYRTEIDKVVVDGKELIGKHDIASCLNDYFTTIASSLLPSQQSHDCPVDLQQEGLTSISNNRFKCHAVSENDVFKVLRTMYISEDYSS